MKWVEYENTLLSLQDMTSSKASSSSLGKRNRNNQDDLIAKPKPSPLFNNMSPSNYILSTLKSIPSNDLEQALLNLSFSEVILLFSYIEDWMMKVFYLFELNNVLIFIFFYF